MMCRTVRRIALCSAFFLCFVHAAAGDGPSSPPEPEIPPFAPRLRVDGAEQPVRLRTLALRATVQGGFAEIDLDMVFFNPNNRILEGELQFPLLPGQEISGLALDIAGEMRQGVPVAKARGQEIFEEIERRGVDPALLEATQGNAYKLRVYPIPARGTRRVNVRVLQPLAERDGALTLRLPLAFAKNLETFSVEALVAADEPPQVESGTLGLVLERAGTLYRGKVEGANLSPEGWLVISLPTAAKSGGNGGAVRWRDKVYFTAAAAVDIRAAARRLPKIVTVVWDASGSGRERDHAREYALLDKYFAALGDGLVRLVVVRNAAEPAREFTVRQGDWSEIKSCLHGLDYDGGTDLASWNPSDDCDEYLLFSDGLANFGGSRGESALPSMRPDHRLYAVTAATGADHNLLRHASRGRLIDLLRHDGETAARLLLEDRTVVSLPPEELSGMGEALLDPFASVPEPGTDRLLCRLAGWIRAGENTGSGSISLRLEHPDGKRESIAVALPLRGDIPRNADEDVPLSARLWGRYAVAEMEADANRHQAAIRRLGQELGIVSRETSLIVLETAEDYLRYDVAPPASLADEVARLREGSGRPDRDDGFLPMERLEGLWAKKVAWWERDFSASKRKKESPAVQPQAARRQSMERRAGDMEFADAAVDSRIAESAAFSARSMPLPTMAAPSAAEERLEADMSVARPEPPVSQGGAASRKDGDIGIAMQTWRSDAPYIERMNRAKKEDMYAIYLDERPGYNRSSAFFLDMADRFFARQMPELGLRILSNLAEIEVENRQLLRMLAYRLLEAKEAALALGVLEKVRELAPYEPQSLRDLAIAHRDLGNLREAAELLYEVARRKWDERFADVNVIALTELNALVATSGGAVDASLLDRRLLRNLASDLRVVLTWDSDNTDMDLWVTDPDGEKCSYENRLTRQGGAMSRDCTGGYGPEEFMLRKAKPGVYRVEVDYYGSSQQVLAGEVTLSVALTTGFGSSGQRERVVTMRLKREKSRVLVGEFTVE